MEDEITKGKVKSLLRKFEKEMNHKIADHFDNINAQLKSVDSEIYSKLDKKYGGMYKILINTFLTKIEQRLYNCEVAVESVKRLLKEELYSLYCVDSEIKDEMVISATDYAKGFDEEFEKTVVKVHEELKEQMENKSDEEPTKEDNKAPESEEAIQDDTE